MGSEDHLCPQCGRRFSPTKRQLEHHKYDGSRMFCSAECRNGWNSNRYRVHDPAGQVKGKRGPVRGPCPVCQEMFRSYGAKIYCSMDCYLASGRFQELARANVQKLSEEARHRVGADFKIEVRCLNCGEKKKVQMHDRHRKYCSQACYRTYLAGRFDRWIANPESLALPQNYDEFMLQEELPCLVDGCEWMGKNLGYHVNAAHGITADQFKELAGFNKSTGLVSIDLHQKLSAMRLLEFEEGRRSTPINFGHTSTTNAGTTLRQEGREHGRKAHALLNGQLGDRVKFCRQCNKEVRQPVVGQRLYCSVSCRSDFYAAVRVPLVCDVCNKPFEGSPHQKRQHDRGEVICCSASCKGWWNCQKSPQVVGKERSENGAGS